MPYLSKRSLAHQLTGLLNNNAANPSSHLLVYTVEIILAGHTVPNNSIGVETVEAKGCSEQNA